MGYNVLLREPNIARSLSSSAIGLLCVSREPTFAAASGMMLHNVAVALVNSSTLASLAILRFGQYKQLHSAPHFRGHGVMHQTR
jgi:hypothetical protein